MQHFKRLSLALTLTALMAGCSTGVKLDEAPVEDRSASSQMGSNAGSTSQSGVAGVNLGQSDRSTAGPMGVSRTVYFDFDSYVVKPEYQSTLDAHARFIKAVPGRTVVLEGHTDDRVGANTTWPWDSAAPKPYAAPWPCWVWPMAPWKPSATARKNPL